MEHRRPSVIGPLILITLGVLFLLANFNLLPFSIWEVALRFWPLILILVGLEIIFGRRSGLGALIVIVLWVALVSGIVWLAFTQGELFAGRAAAITESLTEPLGDIQSATLELHRGVAAVTITALNADTNDLLRGTFGHNSQTRVRKDYSVAGNQARLVLSEETLGWMPFMFGESWWNLALTPNLPLSIKVESGVGRATLDLSALKITALDVEGGVGSVDVVAPKTGATIRIKGGVGNARITIPEGVAAQIRADKGVGNIRVNETRFAKSGNTYASANYASAEAKIEIFVDGGVGGIEVR